MSQPLTKDELKNMFREYTEMRDTILNDETYTGKRATVHRRMANAVLSYAKEYTDAFADTLVHEVDKSRK